MPPQKNQFPRKRKIRQTPWNYARRPRPVATVVGIAGKRVRIKYSKSSGQRGNSPRRHTSSFACAVSWPAWLLFTGVLARCVVSRVRCPGPLGSSSPVCSVGALCCACGVLATWLLLTGVLDHCVVLRVRCSRPLGSCSRVCSLDAFRCVCGVPGHLAPVHRCAGAACFVACAVSWATWPLFPSAHA